MKVKKIKCNTDEGSTQDDSGEDEAIWKQLDDNYKSTLPFIEQTVDRWNARSQTQNVQMAGKTKTMNKTII